MVKGQTSAWTRNGVVSLNRDTDRHGCPEQRSAPLHSQPSPQSGNRYVHRRDYTRDLGVWLEPVILAEARGRCVGRERLYERFRSLWNAHW